MKVWSTWFTSPQQAVNINHNLRDVYCRSGLNGAVRTLLPMTEKQPRCPFSLFISISALTQPWVCWIYVANFQLNSILMALWAVYWRKQAAGSYIWLQMWWCWIKLQERATPPNQVYHHLGNCKLITNSHWTVCSVLFWTCLVNCVWCLWGFTPCWSLGGMQATVFSDLAVGIKMFFQKVWYFEEALEGYHSNLWLQTIKGWI